MKHPVRRRVVAYGVLAVVLGGTWRLRSSLFNLYRGRGWSWPKSIARVLKEHEPRVRAAYEPLCTAVGIQWPPRRIHFVAFKQELLLETWVANAEGPFARITTHPIQGSSGKLGPKTVSGDFQVPEGFYRINRLNPDSAFHLSLRVDYPNADDLANATVPRNRMGGDIYVHGGHASVGCLAMGDRVIEELFCLAAHANPDERHILISPVDYRRPDAFAPPTAPWVEGLYARIAGKLRSNFAKT